MSVQAVKKGEFPNFKPGDTVRVHLRVVEGDSERVQVFEGVVIRRRGEGISETFTVRKISFGVGVERTVPLHSPRVQKIELAKTGRARRARLYYLRNLRGKAARLSEEARPRGEEAAENRAAPDGAKSAPAAQEPASTERAPRAEAAPA